MQPEVEGIITQILVKSGDRVRVGTPLIRINAEKQAAAVRSAEADRAGTEADVAYWRQQVKRMESLVGAGAISRQEFDQAQNSLRTAEARLAALDAQVSQGRVELGFYRVNAAQAGVIGDIPVRRGDRVTTSTVLTTITENLALEAYIEVPIERAPELRMGLPVQLLDGDGKVVATNPISFIAPRVDESTQSVLVKSQLRNAPPSARVQQFIKARIVWKNRAGPHGSDRRRHEAERSVLLLRRRAAGRRARRQAASASGRRNPRRRLRRGQRPEARRTHHRDRDSEARRRGTRQSRIRLCRIPAANSDSQDLKVGGVWTFGSWNSWKLGVIEYARPSAPLELW